MADHLRLVTNNSAPAAAVTSIEMFCFVQGPAGSFAMRNGKQVPLGECVLAIADLAHQLADAEIALRRRDDAGALARCLALTPAFFGGEPGLDTR